MDRVGSIHASAVKVDEESRAILRRIRLTSVVLVILHIICCIFMMWMGFTPKESNDTYRSNCQDDVVGESSKKTCGYISRNMSRSSEDQGGVTHSSSIALLAFAGIITVVWATASSVELYDGSRGHELPSWAWHNRQYLLGVLMLGVMEGTLIPSIFLFLLRSQGSSYWELMLDDFWQNNCLQVFRISFLHFATLFMFAFVNIGSTVYISILLRRLQEEEVAMDGNIDVEVDTPVKIMVGAKLVADFIFVLDLILIVGNSPVNSVLVGSLMLMLLVFAATVHAAWKLRSFMNGDENFKSWLAWLRRFRVLVATHLFFSWIFWWSTQLLFALLNYFCSEFWAVLQTIDNTRSGIIYATGVCFVVFVAVYIYYLNLHQTCMSKLDMLSKEKVNLELSSQALRSNQYTPSSPKSVATANPAQGRGQNSESAANGAPTDTKGSTEAPNDSIEVVDDSNNTPDDTLPA